MRASSLWPFALGLCVLGLESEALAYCRATSCACKNDTPIIDPATGSQALNDIGVPQTTCGQPTGQCPRDENGCQIKGTPNAWAGGCVGFSPNLAGTTQLSADDITAAFDTAFQAWALADCGGGKHPSIQAFMLRPTTCAASEYDQNGPNVNSIYFTDDGWGDFKNKVEIDEVIARTKTNFDSAGVISDADMAINSATHDFTVADGSVPGSVNYDLISIVTHEAGHFFGLDHSPDPNAIMFWSYDAGVVKRALSPDDIAAICAAYPPDRVTTCDPTPKGGLADSCGPHPTVKAGCSSAPDEPGAGASAGVPGVLTILGVSMLWAKRKRGKGQ